MAPRARSRRVLHTTAAILATLAACRPDPASTAPPDATASAPAPAPAPPATADKPAPGGATIDAEAARAEAKRILEGVALARNLDLSRSVQVEVIDKAGIRAFAKESMYENTTPEHLRLMGRMESALGVVPPGLDAEAVILDLLEQGVLGLYDPKKQTLFIGDFVSKAMLSMVVGHEIAHGLQDMHFDLKRLQDPMLHQADAETARRFLVEGDAQASYVAWVSGPAGLGAVDEAVLQAISDQAIELASIGSPYPILARSLQMPYADGTATVARLVKKQGWAAVDALYAELPQSSEQMLHLDKLLAREKPIAVSIASSELDALLATHGLAQVWHDDLGEAALLAMIAQTSKVKAARKAAAGWGGDKLVVYESSAGAKGPTVVAAVTAWDTENDAIEFEAAFAQYLKESDIPGHVIERRGTRCAFAVGVPPEITRRAMLDALWKGAKIGPNASSPVRARSKAASR
jgi:hypothetical protein